MLPYILRRPTDVMAASDPLDWIINGHTVDVMARIRRASPAECTQALSILDARRKAGHRVAQKIVAIRRRLRICRPS